MCSPRMSQFLVLFVFLFCGRCSGSPAVYTLPSFFPPALTSIVRQFVPLSAAQDDPERFQTPTLLNSMFTAAVAPILRPADPECPISIPSYASYDYGMLGQRFLDSLTVFANPSDVIKDNIYFSCRKVGDAHPFKSHLNDTESIKKLDLTARFAFYMPGLTGSCADLWIDQLTGVWSNKGKMNVCCLEWSKYSKTNYLMLFLHVLEDVGRAAAEKLTTFERISGIDRSQIILGGHSLGAQVIGAITRYLDRPKVPLCIVLDPAAVGYPARPLNEKMHASACTHVKAIYTERLIMGILEDCGDENIVFNGGFVQPQCHETVCSHFSSLVYFTEAVRGTEIGKYYYLRSPDGTIIDILDPFSTTHTGSFTVQTNKCFPYFD